MPDGSIIKTSPVISASISNGAGEVETSSGKRYFLSNSSPQDWKRDNKGDTKTEILFTPESEDARPTERGKAKRTGSPCLHIIEWIVTPDGGISGFAMVSGEQIRTSQIVKGEISSGSIVQTKAGRLYYLT